jgi:hypothetical protein
VDHPVADRRDVAQAFHDADLRVGQCRDNRPHRLVRPGDGDRLLAPLSPVVAVQEPGAAQPDALDDPLGQGRFVPGAEQGELDR